MEDFRKKKGKEGTRGADQIARENVQTLRFYRNMILIANVIYALYFTGKVFQGSEFNATEMAMWILCAIIYAGSYQFFAWSGTPKFGDRGKVVDPGVDLNMPQGVAEHVKDLIILTSGTQILSLISNYMWLCLLFAPLRAFWMVWVNIISPWLFAPATEEEVDPKKQRKLEKKFKKTKF